MNKTKLFLGTMACSPWVVLATSKSSSKTIRQINLVQEK